MFVNLETSDFREAINTSCADQWPGIAAAILRRNDREVAIGKIADQLQCYATEQAPRADTLHASLYGLALARIDFFTLALELVLGAEKSDPTLLKQSSAELDEFGDEAFTE